MKLAAESLGKQYRENTWGIRDVTIEMEEGIHGLLGPNGAGKSTLMKILTTVMKPSTGKVHWNGTDIINSPAAVRSELGYLPQDFGVYPDLTAEEFLEYIAALRGLNSEAASARIEEMLALTNLQWARDDKLKSFSGGMRQRVGIAQALVNDPNLLVVDEPTVGLDPEERVRFRNVLSNTANDRIVILSTHIVPDVEATANRVALLDRGHLVTHTRPEDLVQRVSGKVYECTISRSALGRLSEDYQVCSTVQRSDGIKVRVIGNSQPADDAKPVEPTLEDAYLDTIDKDGI
ncbi:ABC transporter ATP-binding protein [Halomicroarcula sp. GCM10025709]|uniref:ABC transporter ATP-binding protein n=1 Tax=Haloarcula TaxID=2237 RepID=UPI0024C2B34A|nr:ABC transporter ATP-binding protein [Halomicroarcula sp. YJ-61-S]